MKHIILPGAIVLCVCSVLSMFWGISRLNACGTPLQPLIFDDRALDVVDAGLPVGWTAGAPGVRVGQFSADGVGKSVHMLGIATWLSLPRQQIDAGRTYCVRTLALADSPSMTAVRSRWIWTGENGLRVERLGAWQSVRAWAGTSDQRPWSTIADHDRAPLGATHLEVRFEPASDDRVYLDKIELRSSVLSRQLASIDTRTTPLTIRPWPAGFNAAVSFSYDWETTMGGLIHSRSIDDPNVGQDPLIRGMRMREGLTNSLALFAPHHFVATYYVNGYNFLWGNKERRTFMDNPTFAWASASNGWRGDSWLSQPWFGVDPYGDYKSHPEWYFGDLIQPVQRAGHDIQSHTFSHFYGGLASPQEWRRDTTAWNEIAAERGVAPATSLAFPWSSSAGMRYDAWQTLVDAGMTSLTRTSWNPKLPQYHIVSASDARCRPLPGHSSIMVCPDFYLTVQSQEQAIALLERIRKTDGMIDYWAHTEEVYTSDQIRAWKLVVDATADARDVWVASLREIAHRQQLIDEIHVRFVNDAERGIFRLHNPSNDGIVDVQLELSDSWVFVSSQTTAHVVTLPAGGFVEIEVQRVSP
ncbi:MAG: polysaccharide deacetylase [Chloroflexi bacterium]|nr:polysaccharide deacetylase [Chloroflexota bacterium]